MGSAEKALFLATTFGCKHKVTVEREGCVYFWFVGEDQFATSWGKEFTLYKDSRWYDELHALFTGHPEADMVAGFESVEDWRMV